MSSTDTYEQQRAEEKANRQLIRGALARASEATTIEDLLAAGRDLAKVGIKMLDEIERDA